MKRVMIMTRLTDKTIIDIKNPYFRKLVILWVYPVTVILYGVSTPFIYATDYLWPSLQEAGHDIKQGFIELHRVMKSAWRGRAKV